MSCNCVENKTWEFDTNLLESDLQKYADVKGSLIAVLQKAQEIYGYLSMDLLEYIAYRTGIQPANVLGVVTFYKQFRIKPVGKHIILLCKGTACHVNGSSHIEEAIREHLNIDEGDITEDGLFTYTNVACLGCCSLAPAMMVGDRTYGKLTKELTIKILEEIVQAETAQ